jgi:hypothetical protein
MELYFGFFTIDLTSIFTYIQNAGPVRLFCAFLALGGWLLPLRYFVHTISHTLEHRATHRVTHEWKWVTLAVDMPQMNVQTPMAVEQMFAHLAGALDSTDFKGKYWTGFAQKYFSFEIVSIEGYIQFVVRTEESLADLIQTALYAQYPEVEITEIEDYITLAPETVPSTTHEAWVSDFGLAENDAYPIRSYKDFEHNISKDTVLKDPIGTFLESFSRIGSGEQMWFQIIVEPISNSWKESAIAKINEIIGAKVKHAHGNFFADLFVNFATKTVAYTGDYVLGLAHSESADAHGKDDGPPNQLSFLTPGQKKIVEAMEDKISKIGFKVKMRGVYIAKKEVFRKSRAVTALIGAINQYNVPTANSIVSKDKNKHGKKVPASKLYKAYRERDLTTGAPTCVMNIEELATIWHFPMSHVKTPLVQKASIKYVEPPAGLPTESVGVTHAPTLGVKKDPGHVSDGSYDTDSGPRYGSGQQFG